MALYIGRYLGSCPNTFAYNLSKLSNPRPARQECFIENSKDILDVHQSKNLFLFCVESFHGDSLHRLQSFVKTDGRFSGFWCSQRPKLCLYGRKLLLKRGKLFALTSDDVTQPFRRCHGDNLFCLFSYFTRQSTLLQTLK